MQIQRLPNGNQPGRLQGPTPPPPQQPQEEKWDKVSFDKDTNTYHFERPGLHYSVARTNPLKMGLGAAALIGVPSAIGAAEHLWLGGLGATGLTTLISPGIGGLAGGTAIGLMSYKESKSPIHATIFGALGGGVCAVAYPLLKLPGVWGGPIGAAVAAGAVGAGVAIWSAVNNGKIDAKAQAAGYKPE
jgi:hypothetical protein